MKKWARISILAVLAVFAIGFGSFSVGQAEETAEGSSPSTGEQTKVQEDTKAPDYQAKLEARLAKKKELLQTKITKAQQYRIKIRCKSAQGKITSVNANVKTFKNARVAVYDKIAGRLAELSAKLKEAGADTTELDKQITQLQTLISNFKSNVTELNQSGVDLANMDCMTDPDGFKAALEAMRTERKSVSADSAAIREYIRSTIKPTLQTIRESVAKTDKTEDN